MDKLKQETIELIRMIYSKYPSGGALHIVLDDGNVDDTDILWCIKHSFTDRDCCPVEDRGMFEQCAINLLKLGTEKKRHICIEQAFKGAKMDGGNAE